MSALRRSTWATGCPSCSSPPRASCSPTTAAPSTPATAATPPRSATSDPASGACVGDGSRAGWIELPGRDPANVHGLRPGDRRDAAGDLRHRRRGGHGVPPVALRHRRRRRLPPRRPGRDPLGPRHGRADAARAPSGGSDPGREVGRHRPHAALGGAPQLEQRELLRRHGLRLRRPARGGGADHAQPERHQVLGIGRGSGAAIVDTATGEVSLPAKSRPVATTRQAPMPGSTTNLRRDRDQGHRHRRAAGPADLRHRQSQLHGRVGPPSPASPSRSLSPWASPARGADRPGHSGWPQRRAE